MILKLDNGSFNRVTKNEIEMKNYLHNIALVAAECRTEPVAVVVAAAVAAAASVVVEATAP